jgi:pyruvate formate lyase activating enzyme
MKISGLQKTSLLDYPDKVSAIIFTQGCGFRCGYCHNPELIPVAKEGGFGTEEILEFLKKRKKVLDAIVITGGEPTLQKDLPEFIQAVKNLGYLVKLDTNGTNPEMLEKLIKKKLIDYIAMDIKAPLRGYDRVTQVKVDKERIKKSIKLIMKSGLDYEFRSTILPQLHTSQDIKAMARMIKGAKKYYLQTFLNQGKIWDKSLAAAQAFSSKEMRELARACSEFVEKCEVR